MYVFSRTDGGGRCGVHAGNRLPVLKQRLLSENSERAPMSSTEAPTTRGECFLQSQHIPSGGTRQENRSLGAQPAPNHLREWQVIWLKCGGGGVGRSPKLPSHLKQHREVYLNELPFPPSWPTRDWSEKWAVAVFPARLPRGWGGPGVLNPAASLPDGPRRRGCSLPQSAAWWTLVCVPSVRRMGWETAEMRLLPPWPPKQGF